MELKVGSIGNDGDIPSFSDRIADTDNFSDDEEILQREREDHDRLCVNKKKHGWTAFLVATASTTYGLHGYINSVTNGILTLDTFLKQFPSVDTEHTIGEVNKRNSTTQGVMVGAYLIGCSIGAGTCFFLTGRYGRKRVIQLLGFCNFIGVLLQVTSFSLGHMIAGRLITGLGVGAGHATFPMYLGESISAATRGRAIFACAATCNLMHLLGAAVMVAFYFVQGSSIQWRLPVAFGLLLAIPSAIMPYWITETPRWLLTRGKTKDALHAYAKLTGGSINEPRTVAELEEIHIAMQEAHSEAIENSANSAPAPKQYWRAVMAIVIQIMASMSGIDVISYYSTVIFQQQLHYSPIMARYLTMGLQGCQFAASTTAMFLIDIIGRRPLVLTAAVLMAISMGFLFDLLEPDAGKSSREASIFFQFLTMIAYPIGLHLIPSTYSAELAPGTQRHQITAIAGCVHWMFNFMVSMITPFAFDSISSRYYLVYMAANIFTFFFVLLLYPETKGLSLEAIDHIFESSQNYFDAVPISRRLYVETVSAENKRKELLASDFESNYESGAELEQSDATLKSEKSTSRFEST